MTALIEQCGFGTDSACITLGQPRQLKKQVKPWLKRGTSAKRLDGLKDERRGKWHYGGELCESSEAKAERLIIGATNISTDATCSNTFSVTLSAPVTCSFFATATATDGNGNTSEFSACRESVSVDTDGDGACDVEEVLAGTDPNNAASVVRITAITHEGNDLRVTWQTAGGRTNQLQAAPVVVGDHSIGNFTDLGAFTVLSGSGDTSTNRVDAGAVTNGPARYYRVRLVR
jgi:hypothetical protein